MSCMLHSLNIMQKIIGRHFRVMHYFRGHNDGTAAAIENKSCIKFMNQQKNRLIWRIWSSCLLLIFVFGNIRSVCVIVVLF